MELRIASWLLSDGAIVENTIRRSGNSALDASFMNPVDSPGIRYYSVAGTMRFGAARGSHHSAGADRFSTANWGTIFWGQTYTDWEQIDLPNLTVAIPNPSHVLDYDRFASDSNLAYQQLQIDLLRSNIQSSQWITTNVMLDMFDIDYHALAKPLTFISWDSYPTGQREPAALLLYLPGKHHFNLHMIWVTRW